MWFGDRSGQSRWSLTSGLGPRRVKRVDMVFLQSVVRNVTMYKVGKKTGVTVHTRNGRIEVKTVTYDYRDSNQNPQ